MRRYMKGEIAVEGRVNPVSEKKKHTHNQITGKGILASVSLVILVVLMFCITTVTIAEHYRVKSDHGSYSDTNNHEPPHFSTHVVFFVLQKLLLLCKTFFCESKPCKNPGTFAECETRLCYLSSASCHSATTTLLSTLNCSLTVCGW